MKVSLSWLKEYVPLVDGVEQLAEKLTMAGLEVDTIEDRFHYLDSVKVAHVEAVAPHPNADKLKCCTVSTGKRQGHALTRGHIRRFPGRSCLTVVKSAPPRSAAWPRAA